MLGNNLVGLELLKIKERIGLWHEMDASLDHGELIDVACMLAR